MTPEQLRAELIDKYSDRFAKDVKQWQNIIFKILSESYFPKVAVEEGSGIKVTSSNISLTVTEINKAFEAAKTTKGTSIIKTFLKNIAQLQAVNQSYFTEFATAKKLESASKRVINTMNTRLGIKSGSIAANGYMGQVFALEEPMARVKREAIKAISSGVPRETFERTMKFFLKGGELDGKKSEGVVFNHMRVNSFDAYAQYDRSVGLEYAKELELNYARYAGGLIDTSRPFCKDRNRKVFHRDEIASWANLDFQGKPANYDPFRDLGGYNCRHILNWISDERAKKLIGES